MRKNKTEQNTPKKKMSKKKIIIIIVAILIIGALAGTLEPAEELAIDWKEDENYGLVTFDMDIDGEFYVKDFVVTNFYGEVASLLETLNKESLKEGYEYIEFEAHLWDENTDKVIGVISGQLPIDFLQNYEDFSTVAAQIDIEENMENLFLPTFLEEEN